MLFSKIFRYHQFVAIKVAAASYSVNAPPDQSIRIISKIHHSTYMNAMSLATPGGDNL